jgi:hypothetical protein
MEYLQKFLGFLQYFRILGGKPPSAGEFRQKRGAERRGIAPMFPQRVPFAAGISLSA